MPGVKTALPWKLVWLITCLLQLPALHAQGETAESASAELRRFTLQQAIDYARVHHPRLRSQQDRLRAAQTGVAAADAQWLPQIGVMAQVVAATANNSTATMLGTSVVDLPRVGATTVDDHPGLRPYASTAVALGLRQQLFDFGRIEAEAAAQRTLAAVERVNAVDLLVEIETGVASAYHAVVAARAILEASRAAESRANRHTDMAKTAAKAGLRPAIELARAEADSARYELGVLRAETGLRVARTLFAAACGVGDQELDAGGDATSAELKPLSEVLEIQRAHDPIVLKSKALAAAQKAQAGSAEAQDRPRLYASASINGRAGGARASNGVVPTGNGLLPSVPNWNVGVVFAWPVYDAVLRKRQQAAQLLGRALEGEALEIERTQRAQVTALYEQARVAAASLAALTKAERAAHVNYSLAEQRFSLGLGSSIELSDAQMLLIEAQVQLALGKSEVLQKRARLARAIGGEP